MLYSNRNTLIQSMDATVESIPIKTSNNRYTTYSYDSSSNSSNMQLISATPSLQSILTSKKISSFNSKSIKSSFNSSYNSLYISSFDSESASDNISYCLTDDFYSSIDDSESFLVSSSDNNSDKNIDLLDHPLSSSSKTTTESNNDLDLLPATSKSKSKRELLYINLSKSLNKLKNSSFILNALSFNERVTDIRIPVKLMNVHENEYNHDIHPKYLHNNTIETLELHQKHEQEEEQPEYIPLKTFNTTYTTRLSSTTSKTTNILPPQYKSREPRINSQFLRFYALDYSCKSLGLLPIFDYEIDLYQNELYDKDSNFESIDSYLDEFDYQEIEDDNYRDNLKLGLLSREKLWCGVILPPRNDICQNTKKNYISINDNNYPNASSNCLVRSHGKFLPWLNIDDFHSNNKKCFKPYGYLDNNVQFTVKGWCNERWLPQS